MEHGGCRCPLSGDASILTGVHKDQLWGDINVVNGVPWPVMDIKSTWHRFRVLNASPSRPWNLQVGQPACSPLLPVAHMLCGPCVSVHSLRLLQWR